MRTTWIAADQIISPLGETSLENYRNIRAGRTGITLVDDGQYSRDPVYLGRIVDRPLHDKLASFTRFERLVVSSIQGLLKKIDLDTRSKRVIFILSTTKGNIDLMTAGGRENHHLHLPRTAATIAHFFGNPNRPLVVSNACVSGVSALILAKRLIGSEQFDHAIVTGADILSRFVVSGFQSLSALSTEPCKPFDKLRKGTTLGEAVASVVLSGDPGPLGIDPKIKIMGGGLSNDANHISGPSRTGEELAMAIAGALKSSSIDKDDIDFISAHGTATLFNDEMEAKAFNISGLRDTPLNSLKGCFGHTLGAAGVLETILSAHALLNNELLPTVGFEELGVSVPVNIGTQVEPKKSRTCLKTASGFGGCNAALVLGKED